MYERLKKCPLCESVHFSNYKVVKDHAISQEAFTITECGNCGLFFTNPRPEEQNIQKYYESQNYISHSQNPKNAIDLLYHLVRTYTTRQKLSWINHLQPQKGRILDVGCGTGHFLSLAQKKNWKTIGIEPNDRARKIANQKKLEVKKNIEELKTEKKFDIITLFHVLEHIHQLDNTLNQIISTLKKRGNLLIAVPNHDSHDRKKYQEHWAAYDIPRHLYHFDLNSMKFLAEKYSLRIKKIIPMKFDSYYVSLLSDKFINPKANPLQSFLKGNKFNKMAKSDGNYSSLVFVLKKK